MSHTHDITTTSDMAWANKRLYGWSDNEWLEVSLDDAVAEWHEQYLLWEEDPFPVRIRFREYSVLPRGESGNNRVLSGAEIAEWVAEHFGDDCGFEPLWEQYERAAKDLQVVQLFDAARRALVERQTFLCADRQISTIEVLVFPDGSYERIER